MKDTRQVLHPGLAYHNANGTLYFCEQELATLAEEYGTPLYIYSASLVRSQIERIKKALLKTKKEFSHLICYSVKANSNLSLLKLIQQTGCGADIVSAGELYRAQKAGVPCERIVFAGSGKTASELEAALKANILLFSVESHSELLLLAKLATQLGRTAKVSLRINPEVVADTHPYISTGKRNDKFGIGLADAVVLFEKAKEYPWINICGLGFHIGSQIVGEGISAFRQAAKTLAQLIVQLELKGLSLEYIDVGGGLGIRYATEEEPDLDAYVESLVSELPLENGVQLLLEPGRFIVGNAGVLLTQIVYIKERAGKIFYIADAAMNDLSRPSLYQAYHAVWPHLSERLSQSFRGSEETLEPAEAETKLTDLVGPICETGDFLSRGQPLPKFQVGDYAVLCSVGAYGFSMASNYNSRCRPAELLIETKNAQEACRLIRARESYDDLVRGEVNFL